jgi:hypothetical protein
MSEIASVFETLSLLTPYEVEGKKKIRLGARNDGGYICLDFMDPSQAVISYGIGLEVSLELSLAQRGHDVLLFDHTVEGPPVAHPRFHYVKEGVGGEIDPAQRLSTLTDHLQRFMPDRRGLLLKMDAEGGEWGALNDIAPDMLCRFDQIWIEMHHLDRLGDGGWRATAHAALAKLAAHFTLFHVHANNYEPLYEVEGFPVPNPLELSWVRTDLIRRGPNGTLYPTRLDAPSFPNKPERLLWFWPFLPLGDYPEVVQKRMADVARRADADMAIY